MRGLFRESDFQCGRLWQPQGFLAGDLEHPSDWLKHQVKAALYGRSSAFSHTGLQSSTSKAGTSHSVQFDLSPELWRIKWGVSNRRVADFSVGSVLVVPTFPVSRTCRRGRGDHLLRQRRYGPFTPGLRGGHTEGEGAGLL